MTLNTKLSWMYHTLSTLCIRCTCSKPMSIWVYANYYLVKLMFIMIVESVIAPTMLIIGCAMYSKKKKSLHI